MIANISDERIVTAIESLRPVAQFLTRDISEAEELVEETLNRSLANQDCYQGDITIKAWLYTVMRNIYINDKRYKKRFKSIDLRAPLNYYDFEAAKNRGIHKHSSAKTSLLKTITEILVYVFPDVLRLKLEFYYLGYKIHELTDYLKRKYRSVEEYDDRRPADNLM